MKLMGSGGSFYSIPKARQKHSHTYLTKDKSPVSEKWRTQRENWKMKMKLMISQMAIKIWIWRLFIKLHNKGKKLKHLNWAFDVLRFKN